MGFNVHRVHCQGTSRALLLTPDSSLWSVGLSVSTQPILQGNLPCLGTRTRLSLHGSFQSVPVATYCSWKGRQLYTRYILAVDGHLISLLPSRRRNHCAECGGSAGLLLLQSVTACPSQREMSNDKGSLGETMLASLQVT